MYQHLSHIALVVRDYDEAIEFFCGRLNFDLLEDKPVPEQNKRWVVIAPPGGSGAAILLARAATDEQRQAIGDQCGGRVFLFLHTDDFWRDYEAMRTQGIEFVRPPADEAYGTVAVWLDLYGNRWDLVQLHPDHPINRRLN